MKNFFKSKKGKVLIVVVVILLVISALVAKACSTLNNAVNTFSNYKDTAVVEVRDLSDSISASGTVEGISKNNVISCAAAEVTAVNYSVGDAVEAGAVLCSLNTEEIQAKIDELNNSIAKQNKKLEKSRVDADEAVKEAEKDLTDARNELQAKKDNEESSVMSVSELEKMVKTAEKALAAAKDNVEELKDSKITGEDELKELKNQLNDCEITAPIAGVITAVNVSVGEKNTPNAVLFTIEDTSKLKIKVGIDEADILRVEQGMVANVTATALGEEVIKGEVTRVVRVKDQSSGYEGSTSGYAAEITIDSSDLLLGMTAKVKIIIDQRENALCVPYDLVRYDDDGQAYILKVEEAETEGMKKAVRCNIELGEEVNYYVEVIGGDLSEGDTILIDYEAVEGDEFHTFDEFDGGMMMY